MKAIVGRKSGMTQLFTEDGKSHPVTVIEVLPNVITQIKTQATDGYNAIQIGYEELKENRANKPEKGIFNKAGTTPKQNLFEVKVEDITAYKVGDKIDVSLFKAGDVVDVIGVSKGKGFSGAIKRWHYTIGAKGHGGGYPHRTAGSMATVGRTNNRIHPGKKMAGHHGHEQATILNLVVMGTDVEKNALLIRGAVPGPKKGLLTVRSAVKKQLGHPFDLKPLYVVKADETAKAE
ncbi:MAG TPA: 50S ribosomal protein L3 [Firmicutes bacterium]|jgi:large subunit ribosomal protein L3|nr:50S ribosomal protein L3 [Bacillota bacterium]